MEIFYYKLKEGNILILDEEESGHCVRVLRHRNGDRIYVADGVIGILYRCEIVDDSSTRVKARVIEENPDWGRLPYQLDLAVCPTKNPDRYEWFVEKACEIGADSIIPIIGERSERRAVRTERLRKIAVSACRQSLKGRITRIGDPVGVEYFLRRFRAGEVNCPVKLMAYCFEDATYPRISIRSALERLGLGRGRPDSIYGGPKESGRGRESSPPRIEWTNNLHILIMIGPEGDFTPEEVRMALERDFIPVHLGSSRLRTETAAVFAAAAIHLHFM